MKHVILAAVAAAGLMAVAGGAQAAGDAAAGEKVFNKCKVCHSTAAGKNMVGPSLFGVLGRTAGTVAGYAYSDANKNSGLTWTPDVLDVYLTDPKAKVPGTKMAFAGLKDATERENVIAYLATLK